jgi:hypothetical protein
VINGIVAAMTGLTVALTVLTGCTQPVARGSQTSAPVTSSDTPVLTGSPEIGGPAYSGSTSLSRVSTIGAGSFPRSFLIPGTDTSIRIGG